MKKFSKNEIKKFEDAVRHIIRENLEEGHDAHSALYCSGITFTEDIRRFNSWAEDSGHHDVVDELASETAFKLL